MTTIVPFFYLSPMAQHNITGSRGEEIAAKHLAGKGFRICTRNWRYLKAEVDIIAEKDNKLVIVEVKTRGSNEFGEPELFVTKQKQKHLAKAAHAYILQNELDMEVRFDIVSVLMKGKEPLVHHIEAAFYPLVNSR